MKRPFTGLCSLAVAAVLLAMLGRPAAAQDNQSYGGAPAVTQPTPTGAPQGYATPPDLPVLLISSVEVIRSTGEPHQDIVRVRGLTGSVGWSAPSLVPLFVGNPADGILDLQFIAQVPDNSQKAAGFVPIDAIFPLEPGHSFKGVRVRAAANVVEVKQIPGLATAKITIDDCSKCVGKKFAPRGTAKPGTAGVVREEDMPRNFRVIPPTKGVAGITHNMNRLNLVLGDDNATIVWAFWE
jgi:hypothetical protein